MKKLFLIVLSAIMMLSVPFTVFAEETKTAVETEAAEEAEESAAASEWFDTLSEHALAFDAEHPELRDMWYELMDSFQTVLTEELDAAFNKSREAVDERFANSEADPALVEEMQEINQEMVGLINSLFLYHSYDSFDRFAELAEDGDYDLKREDKRDEYLVTEEDFQAVLDKYTAFAEEHPELGEKTASELEWRNEILRANFGEAFKNIYDKMETAFADLFEKYEVSEECQGEIFDLFKELGQGINEEFLANVEKYSAYIGPLKFCS